MRCRSSNCWCGVCVGEGGELSVAHVSLEAGGYDAPAVHHHIAPADAVLPEPGRGMVREGIQTA